MTGLVHELRVADVEVVAQRQARVRRLQPLQQQSQQRASRPALLLVALLALPWPLVLPTMAMFECRLHQVH